MYQSEEKKTLKILNYKYLNSNVLTKFQPDLKESKYIHVQQFMLQKTEYIQCSHTRHTYKIKKRLLYYFLSANNSL